MYLRPLAGIFLGSASALILIALITTKGSVKPIADEAAAIHPFFEDRQNVVPEQSNTNVKETVSEIRARGGSAVCSLSRFEGGTKLSGTLAIAGDRYRADIIAEKLGGSLSFELHILRAAGYDYSWTSVLPRGTKTPSRDEPQFSLFAAECRDAQVSNLLFQPPLGIEFVPE